MDVAGVDEDVDATLGVIATGLSDALQDYLLSRSAPDVEGVDELRGDLDFSALVWQIS